LQQNKSACGDVIREGLVLMRFKHIGHFRLGTQVYVIGCFTITTVIFSDIREKKECL